MRKTDAKYKSNAHHFFPLNTTMRKHNENIYANTDSEKLDIHACDFVTGNPSQKARQKAQMCVATSTKYFEKHGLLRVLNAAVGLPYTASVNIKTDDGLINRATCILKKIQFLEVNKKNIPSILWVCFDKETIGQQWRHRYSKFYEGDLHREGVPKLKWSDI